MAEDPADPPKSVHADPELGQAWAQYSDSPPACAHGVTAVDLIRWHGVGAIEPGDLPWTQSDRAILDAALRLLSAAEKTRLAGTKFVKVSDLGRAAGITFTYAHQGAQFKLTPAGMTPHCILHECGHVIERFALLSAFRHREEADERQQACRLRRLRVLDAIAEKDKERANLRDLLRRAQDRRAQIHQDLLRCESYDKKCGVATDRVSGLVQQWNALSNRRPKPHDLAAEYARSDPLLRAARQELREVLTRHDAIVSGKNLLGSARQRSNVAESEVTQIQGQLAMNEQRKDELLGEERENAAEREAVCAVVEAAKKDVDRLGAGPLGSMLLAGFRDWIGRHRIPPPTAYAEENYGEFFAEAFALHRRGLLVDSHLVRFFEEERHLLSPSLG